MPDLRPDVSLRSSRPAQNEFPSPSVMKSWVERHGDSVRLTPLPFPPKPVHRKHSSANWRLRKKEQLRIYRVAVSMVSLINGLDEGRVFSSQAVPAFDVLPEVRAAQELALKEIMNNATLFVRARREETLSGDHGAPSEHQPMTAKLIKQSMNTEGYVRAGRSVPQVSLIAEAIDEPTSEHHIDMLLGLTAEEAAFYKSEDLVVELSGKSREIFSSIEKQYGFIGGSHHEYLAYWHRPDIPSSLWHWDLATNAKATAGFTAVEKKDPSKQRKLLMACAANYMMVDAKRRADLGMRGAECITSIHTQGEPLAAAALDESNAFTFIETPRWLWGWFAAPAVLACEVWALLPETLRVKCKPWTWVAAQYRRLPMGFSHSVHILMVINLRYIGIVLLSSSKLDVNKPLKDIRNELVSSLATHDCNHQCSHKELTTDEAWCSARSTRVEKSAETTGYSLDKFIQTVRAAKELIYRVVIVCLAFSGNRRPGDIHDWLEGWALKDNIVIKVFSFDLATDSTWDLGDMNVFHALLSLTEQGYIDIWFGGPPCSTVSSARFLEIPGGPRPVRSRDHFWGLADLSNYEKVRVVESNKLYIHFMSLCEAASARGGGHGWEHPGDRGEQPYPSIWATGEMIDMESRTGATRSTHHQCAFGAPVMKITTISSTFDNTHVLDDVFCPGVSEHHTHGISKGRNEDGGFHTTQLQTYTSEYSKAIASCIYATALRLLRTGEGPTGHVRGSCPIQRISNYGFRHQGKNNNSISLLNEDVTQGRQVILDQYQASLYLHVDDLLCLSVCSSLVVHANAIMSTMAQALEENGFIVPTESRQQDHDLQKIIGYAIWRDHGRFTVAISKWVGIRGALLELASGSYLDAEVARAVVGVWLFAALLRRDALCIPHAIFYFMVKYENQVTIPSKRVRNELLAMAAAVPFLYYSYADPIAPVALASDAMGGNEGDDGGYGVMAREVSMDMIRNALEVGGAPGKSIARLSGDLTGLKYPSKRITATKPHTLLHDSWFDTESWLEVTRGRWKHDDGIILGESRAVNKYVNILSTFKGARDSKLIGLQDNSSVSGASAKGRSTAYPLNRSIRKRASLLLATSLRIIMPWVESAKQPADSASRKMQ